MPKLFNISLGYLFIVENKTVPALIIGAWLLIYCYQKDVSGIKAAAYWGVFGIIFFLILIIIDLLYSSWTENMIEDRHLNFVSLVFSDLDIYVCISSII